MTFALPDDPDLPGLVAIQTLGLAATMPELQLDGGPTDLNLRAYRRGRRITLELNDGRRHLAIKAYAKDPAGEVALTEAFNQAGVGCKAGARVPPLVAWNRDLRILVVGWLTGPTAFQLLKRGQGARVADLASGWLEFSATLRIDQGPARDASWIIGRIAKWVDRLQNFEPALGLSALAIGRDLVRTLPRERVRRLVHGTFHDRNLLDCGDGPGVIDWEYAGMGPPELDAGAFLACLSWRAAKGERGLEAERARTIFRAQVAASTDDSALRWHEASGLLCHAGRMVKRDKEYGPVRAPLLLEIAHQILSGRA